MPMDARNLRNVRRYKTAVRSYLVSTLDLVDGSGRVHEAEFVVPENQRVAAKCLGLVPQVRAMIAEGEFEGEIGRM
jgi:hypothetical protein